MPFSFRAIVIAGTIAAFSRGAGAQVRVTGIAYDSIARRPLAGASVIATPEAGVRDTVFHTTVTAADGHFTLPLLLKGAYVFSLEDPALDSLGLSVPARSIAVPARDTSIVLATPSPLGYARLACGAGATDTTGALLGRVQQFAGSGAPGARIVVSWSDFDVDRQTAKVNTKRLTASVVADSLGTYRMCGVPLGRTLLVQAQAGADVQSGVVEEQVGASHVLVRDFTVSHVRQLAAADSTHVQQSSAAPPAADTAAPLGRYILTGRVQGVDGHAIGSAQVRLFGTNRVTTSTDGGDFRLTGLPAGTQGIEVIALGYYPRRARVDVGDNTTPLTMRMEKTAVVLDSIRVVAKRMNTSTAYREFEQRRTTGMGRYLSEEQIEKRNAFQTSDLFRIMPGLSGNHPHVRRARSRCLSNRGNASQAKLPCRCSLTAWRCSPPTSTSCRPTRFTASRCTRPPPPPPAFTCGAAAPSWCGRNSMLRGVLLCALLAGGVTANAQVTAKVQGSVCTTACRAVPLLPRQSLPHPILLRVTPCFTRQSPTPADGSCWPACRGGDTRSRLSIRRSIRWDCRCRRKWFPWLRETQPSRSRFRPPSASHAWHAVPHSLIPPARW